MAFELSTIENSKVKSVTSGESVELKSLWQEQSAVVIFLRRWGCAFCRLWGKELSEIAPVLKEHNIRLIGIGVEEIGAKEYADGNFLDGELYYVEELSTYQKLNFKRFNHFTILTSLLWKQSRNAMMKVRGLGGDLKGDWVQIGGALLVEKGGKLLQHFVQTGPADHMANLDILKNFGLENEYKPETMANKNPEKIECATEAEPTKA